MVGMATVCTLAKFVPHPNINLFPLALVLERCIFYFSNVANSYFERLYLLGELLHMDLWQRDRMMKKQNMNEMSEV